MLGAGAVIDVEGNVDSGDAKVVEEAMTGVSEVDETDEEEMADVDVTTDTDRRVGGDIDTAENDDANEGSETDLETDVPVGVVVEPSSAVVVS